MLSLYPGSLVSNWKYKTKLDAVSPHLAERSKGKTYWSDAFNVFGVFNIQILEAFCDGDIILGNIYLFCLNMVLNMFNYVN